VEAPRGGGGPHHGEPLPREERREPGQRQVEGVPLGGAAAGRPAERLAELVGVEEERRRAGRPQAIADLKAHSCIRQRLSGSGLLLPWGLIDADRDVDVAVKGRMIVSDNAAVVALAMRGLGLAQVAEPLVIDQIRDGQLDTVLNPFAPSSPGLFLHYPGHAQVLPKLRVNEMYTRALKQTKGAVSGSPLGGQLQEARWFIKNIQQRFDTIERVSQAIVERQAGFFSHGELAMRPLVLREIADELGLHESTISRVTTQKYMATPHGTFELKFFFGSGLNTDAGGEASSTAVRALIRQFIAAEDVKKPLSDSALAAMLEEQGIQCARRTVAKYREGMKIPTAPLRKAP
jgi:RNA polymerase sigma-54 factor